MRTIMDWEMKSQKAFTMDWTTEMRFNVYCALIRNCTRPPTVEKINILTDKFVTYFKYEI